MMSQLTEVAGELRFRPADLYAAAPCALTVQLAKGAVSQRVQLFDATRCCSGGSNGDGAGVAGGDDGDDDDYATAVAAEAAEATSPSKGGGALLVDASPQLAPGDKHTFHIRKPGKDYYTGVAENCCFHRYDVFASNTMPLIPCPVLTPPFFAHNNTNNNTPQARMCLSAKSSRSWRASSL